MAGELILEKPNNMWLSNLYVMGISSPTLDF